MLPLFAQRAISMLANTQDLVVISELLLPKPLIGYSKKSINRIVSTVLVHTYPVGTLFKGIPAD